MIRFIDLYRRGTNFTCLSNVLDLCTRKATAKPVPKGKRAAKSKAKVQPKPKKALLTHLKCFRLFFNIVSMTFESVCECYC